MNYFYTIVAILVCVRVIYVAHRIAKRGRQPLYIKQTKSNN